MTLTITSPQISNARTIPVVPIPVTASTWGEINVPTNTSVIAPVLLVTNLEAVDLATSGPAVNILGEGQDQRVAMFITYRKFLPLLVSKFFIFLLYKRASDFLL